jgi:hypothetical protein
MMPKSNAKAVATEDLVASIGETAGKIWRQLNAEGEMPLSKLAKDLGEKPDRVAMAVGWLAREDKMLITSKANSIRVSLRDEARSW